MRILIFGRGYLGNYFRDYFSGEFAAYCHTEDEVQVEIINHCPDLIINCAGKTGRPNIDWCEDNRAETFESNVLLPYWIAKNSYKTWRIIHIGSGCIYSGSKQGAGYSETDDPNFTGSFYSQTKIISESLLKAYPHVLQLRIRMPIDMQPSPRNLIMKLVQYPKVINVANSITIVSDLLSVSKKLLEKEATGIFNVVNTGVVFHHSILQLYRTYVDPRHKWEIISEAELQTKAKRSNCILSNQKLALTIGEQMPDATTQVQDIIKNWKEMK